MCRTSSEMDYLFYDQNLSRIIGFLNVYCKFAVVIGVAVSELSLVILLNIYRIVVGVESMFSWLWIYCSRDML